MKPHERYGFLAIQDHIARGVCIFTGKPAVSGSFLCQDLFDNKLQELYEKFIEMHGATLTQPKADELSPEELEVKDYNQVRQTYPKDTPKFAYFKPTERSTTIAVGARPRITTMAAKLLGGQVQQKTLDLAISGVGRWKPGSQFEGYASDQSIYGEPCVHWWACACCALPNPRRL